jgi:hypothetical protein
MRPPSPNIGQMRDEFETETREPLVALAPSRSEMEKWWPIIKAAAAVRADGAEAIAEAVRSRPSARKSNKTLASSDLFPWRSKFVGSGNLRIRPVNYGHN